VNREQHLRVPYLLVMESFRDNDGVWYRRAYYPELPDAVAEAPSPIDALDQLEEKRVQIITDRLARGVAIPVPRPPLH
jgi:hypothetical protein